jgi:cation diffusion facilitator family transporter
MNGVARRPPTQFAWLAIGAAIFTISLKMSAYLLTGSVGLLSDTLESLVNLVAAIAALIALTIAEKEPDEEHAYGHAKAEYFSSGLEGALILLAAGAIVFTAVPRLLDPQPISDVGWGLAVSTVASVINLLAGWRLMRAGREYHSITLEADGRHLLTDVWTSVGVLIGIAAVAATAWHWLDPLIALVVAANIVWTGVSLVRRSALGLMDTALPRDERAAVIQVLDRYQKEQGIVIHAFRSRQAASRRFVSMHVLVPGNWTVQRGHRLCEAIERDIRAVFPSITVFTHLEPVDDPISWEDTTLDRHEPIAEHAINR